VEAFEAILELLLLDDALFVPLTISFFLLLFDGNAMAEVFGSLFKLKLESLRADENPLEELVRFDDFERSLSLLKSFNLSSIECFAGCCWDAL
jgi:hypothetical protein